MKRLEINVMTGEQKMVDLTPDEIAEIESRPPSVLPVVVSDPVGKLKAFLVANPDVLEALK